jgi:hypothetical protein
MPTRFNTNYLRLKDDVEFEELIRDICALEWHDPGTELNGRGGQKQFGVDVFGQPADQDGAYYGVQCKLRPSQKKLTETQIEKEIEEARNFPHPLKKLTIATDTPRDNNLQFLINDISERESAAGGFSVEIWFWPDIERRIATYPRVMVKYYHDHLTSLTNTAVLERLVDRPIEILSLNLTSSHVPLLDEHLRFRGVQIASDIATPTEVKTGSYSDILPDGAVFHIEQTSDSKESSSHFKLLTTIFSWEKTFEPSCPIFIILPPAWLNQIKAQLSNLHKQPTRFQLLSNNISLNAIANQIFKTSFQYGYKRRCELPTINISARTKPNKPASALLDLDWQSHLDTQRHPTPSQWQTQFVPALDMVANGLTGLKEPTRIQVNSELPVPASVALGFTLNLHVAILGVWARSMGKRNISQLWLSDCTPAQIDITENWYKDIEVKSHHAILELSIGFSSHATVAAYIPNLGITPDIWVEVLLPISDQQPGGLDEAHAVAYANYIGSLMRRLTEKGITDTHLFLRMPTALGVLIGQKIHACGRIHLYWFKKAEYSYQFAFTLA